ncbi:MAG: response regulator [ANME-2 cluster archaeon]|jgi:PAS domain S-box-containing protein|nr:response regulator [ANME-2 cluster archaeon]
MMPDKRTTNRDVEILIAEDSPTQAEKLKHLLEKAGYTVTAVANGKLALEAAHDRRPALIISDIMMPEMDGFELCRHIKKDEKLKDILVILLTGLSDPGDIMKGLQCGADNFFTKPYDEDYLLSRVQYALLNSGLHDSDSIEMGIEVFFAGEKYHITSGRLQILNLLLSTYEAAVEKNSELIKAQDELRTLNEQLEQIVEERTAALVAEIAERKQVEEALRENEERFRTIFDSVNDAVFIHDIETGAILDVNRTMCDMYGYSREEAVQLDIQALSSGEVPYTQQDALEWNKKAAMGEAQVFEWMAKHKSGHLFWVEVSMKKAVIGLQERLLVVVRDIIERKQAEEELRKLNDELEQRVIERTAELEENNKDLESMVKAFTGREIRMIELKKQIAELEKDVGPDK